MWPSENKNHKEYVPEDCCQVAGLTLRIPPPTGFDRLEGTLLYFGREHSMRVSIFARKAKNNFGPGLMEKETIPWIMGKGGETKFLKEKLNQLAERIQRRQVPSGGMFLEKCNNSGQDVGEFLNKKCAHCKCWYCELSGE